MQIKHDSSLTFKSLLEANISKFEVEVTDLSQIAAKEHSFERQLDKMKTE